MSTRTFALLAWVAFVGLSSRASLCAEARDDGWFPLLNDEDFQGWYTFLNEHGKNNDPGEVFTIDNGVIHVYKHAENGTSVPIGFFATETEYSHCHLRFQYKWGSKRFGIRPNQKRDAGVMYHCVEPDGLLQGTWPRCIECQVQEEDTGDALCLFGTRFSTWVDP